MGNIVIIGKKEPKDYISAILTRFELNEEVQINVIEMYLGKADGIVDKFKKAFGCEELEKRGRYIKHSERSTALFSKDESKDGASGCVHYYPDEKRFYVHGYPKDTLVDGLKEKAMKEKPMIKDLDIVCIKLQKK